MGRPSKLTEKRLGKMASENWHGIAQEFINSKNDEACIMLLMRLHCIFGDVRKMLKTAKVDHYKFEHQVNGGRIDLVLFHSDGGVSLVEVKGRNSTRDVVAGIGQLFFYEAMFLESKPSAKPPSYINKYLVSPIGGVDAERVDSACALAGIKFVMYAPFGAIEKHRSACIENWVDHGA